MLRIILSFFGGVFTFLTMSVVAFALTIGAVFWIYGRDLPSHESLAQYKPPTISRIYSGEGRIVDEFARERRLFTGAKDVPILIKQAFISAEDKNFYSHPGVDAKGVLRATINNFSNILYSRRLEGASTITQQVAKNFLLTNNSILSGLP